MIFAISNKSQSHSCKSCFPVSKCVFGCGIDSLPLVQPGRGCVAFRRKFDSELAHGRHGRARKKLFPSPRCWRAGSVGASLRLGEFTSLSTANPTAHRYSRDENRVGIPLVAYRKTGMGIVCPRTSNLIQGAVQPHCANGRIASRGGRTNSPSTCLGRHQPSCYLESCGLLARALQEMRSCHFQGRISKHLKHRSRDSTALDRCENLWPALPPTRSLRLATLRAKPLREGRGRVAE